MTETIKLSDEAEARIVFWSSPDESVHPASIIAAVTELAPNTLQNLRTSGDGPEYIKRGGRIYYCKAAVLKWLGAPWPTSGSDPHSAASARAAA